MNLLRRWLARRRGHGKPVPAGRARLLLLTDDPWLTFLGTRAWCDGKPRPCPYPGCDRCCSCRHTELRT